MHDIVMFINHALSSNLVLIPFARDRSPEHLCIYAPFRIADVLLMSQMKTRNPYSFKSRELAKFRNNSIEIYTLRNQVFFRVRVTYYVLYILK